MHFPTFIMVISLIEWAKADSCPDKYTKFSANHIACWPTNPNCHYVEKGVSSEEISEILDIHNSLRSKVATGRETRAGGMPEASNMMQMEWDDEIAGLSQILSEQCKPVYICPTCSTTETFRSLGNMYAINYTKCQGKSCIRNSKPSWNSIIQSMYDPRGTYNSSEVGAYHGGWHFTQLIWAETWRIGCGYSSLIFGNEEYDVFVCKYGPEGNVWGMPVYKEGQACTACPLNSCCGDQCKSDEDSSSQNYEGLCKMISPNTAPVYEDKVKASLFYCNFDMLENKDDCKVDIKGTDRWTTTETAMGNIKSIKLSGRERSQLNFRRKIYPKSPVICIRVQFREGPDVAGEEHKATVALKVKNGEDTTAEKIYVMHSDFHFRDVSVNYTASTYIRLHIQYKVGRGSADSILDIKEVAVYDGYCGEYNKDYVEEIAK